MPKTQHPIDTQRCGRCSPPHKYSDSPSTHFYIHTLSRMFVCFAAVNCRRSARRSSSSRNQLYVSMPPPPPTAMQLPSVRAPPPHAVPPTVWAPALSSRMWQPLLLLRLLQLQLLLPTLSLWSRSR